MAAILASAATILALTDGEWVGLRSTYVCTYLHTVVLYIHMYIRMCCDYAVYVQYIHCGRSSERDNSQDTG